MTTIVILLILILIGGVAAASFAAERRRSQAAWFILGGLTGPVGMLVLLLMPVLPERKKGESAPRALLSVILALVMVAAASLAIFEVAFQFEESQRYAELNAWELYGDALIRMGLAKDHPPEALVVKAARNQVADHEGDLREGMRRTENDLLLAVRGVQEVRGARGILANGYRLITFRHPLWPAPVGLSTEKQDRLIKYLEQQLGKYREYLQAIETAQSQWQPKE